MDDGEQLDLGMLVEIPLDVGGVDRVVVRHLELVQLGAEVLQPVAHTLAEHAGDEVEDGRSRPHEPSRRSLEPEHRLPLHEQDVVRGQQELGHPPLGAAEELDEGGVVVIRDLLRLGGEHLRVGHRRPGAQGDVGIAHEVSFQRVPRS
jgi:hypothetical protein